MDPALQEMLARLGELTDDELQDLSDRLVAQFDEADEAGNVDLMDEVAQGIDAVRAESSGRDEKRTQDAARAEELRKRVRGSEDEDEGADGAPAAGEQEAEEDGEKPQAVAASATRTAAPARPPLRKVAAHRNPENAPHNREGDGSGTTTRLMVAAGTRRPGEVLGSWDDFIESMTEKINRLGASTNGDLLIARSEIPFPEDRRLVPDAAEANGRKMEAVTSIGAIVAAGGLCAPVDVDYGIVADASDSEPVYDSLAKFNAPRGGLRFIKPMIYSDVPSTGTTIWTEATDAAPGGAVKPIQTVACGEVDEVLVDAIPTRIRFGNFMGRFSPEVVAGNTRLIMARAAEVRELHLLAGIAAGSTSVSSGQLLGASRDLLATMDLIAAAMRHRHRLPRGEGMKLRAIFPDWAIELVRADLTRELAHGDDSNLALTDQQVTALLQNRGIQVTWTLDGQATTAGSGTQVAFGDQSFRAAQAAGALLDWPTELVWYLFPEGTWQVIDGGTLDLGVVRDSTLDSTNDYETFVEVFRGLAKRGYESLQVVSHVRPNGASAATVQTAPSPVIY